MANTARSGQFLRGYSAWERRAKVEDEERQRRILAVPGCRRALKILVKDGADPQEVLKLLCLQLRGDKLLWSKGLRRKQKELESIANQLETVARHAERVARDPTSYGTLWLALMGIGEWENVRQAKGCAPIWIFRLMRLYAKNCRDKARIFGKLLKTYPPRQRRRFVSFLLAYIWRTTGSPHDQEIARLLTGAYEAVGSEKQFTKLQIQKQRQRHVSPARRQS